MNISHELQWPAGEKKYFKILPAVKYLVIHHTESHDVSVEEVNRWHKNRKPDPFIGIGYHFLIRANGNIERGRPENVWGAHAGAKYNGCSLGIALTGDFMTKTPTEAQIGSLVGLLQELTQSYHGAQIVPHKALSATACPGKLFPWNEMLQRLEEDDMPESPTVSTWKADAVQRAYALRLIKELHSPEEQVDMGTLCALMLNLYEKLKGEK